MIFIFLIKQLTSVLTMIILAVFGMRICIIYFLCCVLQFENKTSNISPNWVNDASSNFLYVTVTEGVLPPAL